MADYPDYNFYGGGGGRRRGGGGSGRSLGGIIGGTTPTLQDPATNGGNVVKPSSFWMRLLNPEKAAISDQMNLGYAAKPVEAAQERSLASQAFASKMNDISDFGVKMYKTSHPGVSDEDALKVIAPLVGQHLVDSGYGSEAANYQRQLYEMPQADLAGKMAAAAIAKDVPNATALTEIARQQNLTRGYNAENLGKVPEKKAAAAGAEADYGTTLAGAKTKNIATLAEAERQDALFRAAEAEKNREILPEKMGAESATLGATKAEASNRASSATALAPFAGPISAATGRAEQYGAENAAPVEQMGRAARARLPFGPGGGPFTMQLDPVTGKVSKSANPMNMMSALGGDFFGGGSGGPTITKTAGGSTLVSPPANQGGGFSVPAFGQAPTAPVAPSAPDYPPATPVNLPGQPLSQSPSAYPSYPTIAPTTPAAAPQVGSGTGGMNPNMLLRLLQYLRQPQQGAQ